MAVTLLVDPDRSQCQEAVLHAKARLNVTSVTWHARADRLQPLQAADLLLNYLSAPKVPGAELHKFEMAINFHPAPPEYPGVGSASLALYDKRTEHGVTAHLMDAEYDHGSILWVRRFKIDPRWGYRQLWVRSLEESLIQFKEVVDLLATPEFFLVPLSHEHWARKSYTRAEFEQHPAFTQVSA